MTGSRELGNAARAMEVAGIGRLALKQARVLVADDEPGVLRGLCRWLRALDCVAVAARHGEEALRYLNESTFDVVLSDIKMPGMDGIQLTRHILENIPEMPVILITGEPSVTTAIQALEFGAFGYLAKPVELDHLERVVVRALHMHRMARIKQEAAGFVRPAGASSGDHVHSDASCELALQKLGLAYQPIVDISRRAVLAYEASLRSAESAFSDLASILQASSRLGRMEEVGRLVRDQVAQAAAQLPPEVCMFTTLQPSDLMDPLLVSLESPLNSVATRVVLEIGEGSRFNGVTDVRARIAQLRELGYRFALDDVGPGNVGMSAFKMLEPEIFKIDTCLVSDVHESEAKRNVVRTMISIATDMGMSVVAKGVESSAQCEVLVELGCNCLQGDLFAAPGFAFPEVEWS